MFIVHLYVHVYVYKIESDKMILSFISLLIPQFENQQIFFYSAMFFVMYLNGPKPRENISPMISCTQEGQRKVVPVTPDFSPTSAPQIGREKIIKRVLFPSFIHSFIHYIDVYMYCYRGSPIHFTIYINLESFKEPIPYF